MAKKTLKYFEIQKVKFECLHSYMWILNENFEREIKALSMKSDYKWVQNDYKNAMTIDKSELTINVLY